MNVGISQQLKIDMDLVRLFEIITILALDTKRAMFLGHLQTNKLLREIVNFLKVFLIIFF